MPRAAGPFKIIEKINDNAYKHELPFEFRVSPTFNISDLKPYLGEEDELELRETLVQEGEDDEDKTPSDTPADPPTTLQGSITRARARQLNLNVSLFLRTSLHGFENRLLPNDCIMIRNLGEEFNILGEELEGVVDQQGSPSQVGSSVQFEFKYASASRTSQC